MYKEIEYNQIKLAYLDHLDGGGSTMGQQFIPVVREKFGRVNHIFEFCAGPGFIGFSLLANNLCERLTLADINPEAVQACRMTVKNNGLESKVQVYLSDCLDNIPESEKWDLVVSNPPHFFCADEQKRREDIRLFDPNFQIHQRFYRDIRKFLVPSGSVLFQENEQATNKDTFKKMIEENGLKIIDVFKVSMLHPRLYFNFGRCRNIFNRCYRIFNPQPESRSEKNIIKLKRYPSSFFITSFYFIWCKFK